MLLIELLKAVLFGLVQGITEWLPISSTGHMILLDELVHLRCTPEFWNTFLVVIQLGSILAVVVLYFHQLNPFSPRRIETRRSTPSPCGCTSLWPPCPPVCWASFLMKQ